MTQWDSLIFAKQKVLLEEFSADALAAKYGRSVDFFEKKKAFYSTMPGAANAKPETHNPPKDLIVNARRDLSFEEANFELFDNAIDEWRNGTSSAELNISLNYDLETMSGVYSDDAGGLAPQDVYQVFIPGASSSNDDFSKANIGSYGMGAKKGIFRLTDGARIVSSKDNVASATSEVLPGWEFEENWNTRDGTDAQPIGAGRTHIYFYNLITPPTADLLRHLRSEIAHRYRHLLSGSYKYLPDRKVNISVNGEPVEPARDIPFADPPGAPVREFTQTVKLNLNEWLRIDKGVTVKVTLRAGLLRKQPGNKSPDDQEPDYGVDVFGNGRLIESFLKNEFGWGTSGMARGGTNSYVRAVLWIDGHSVGIPWDIHKRQYQKEHPLHAHIYNWVRTVLKSYCYVAGRFGQAHAAPLRAEHLVGTTADLNALEVFKIVGGRPPSPSIPQFEFTVTKPPASSPPPDSSQEKSETEEGEDVAGTTPPEESPPSEADEDKPVDDDDDLNVDAEPSNDVELLISLPPPDFSDLEERFGVSGVEAVAEAVKHCLVDGVAFELDEHDLVRLLDLIGEDATPGMLSEMLKQQVLSRLK